MIIEIIYSMCYPDDASAEASAAPRRAPCDPAPVGIAQRILLPVSVNKYSFSVSLGQILSCQLTIMKCHTFSGFAPEETSTTFIFGRPSPPLLLHITT